MREAATGRRAATAVSVLGAAVVLLAGCGSGAPAAAPVSAPVTKVPDSGAVATESGPTSSIPTVQPTSEPPAATATRKPGQCFDRAALDHPKVTSRTTMKPYGARATFSDSGENLSIKVSKAKMVSGGDTGFDAPDEGDSLVVFDVDAAMTGGSLSLISYTQFTLWDPEGNPCRSNIFSPAIKSKHRLSLKMLSTSEPAAKGKIVFEVPSGKDYSGFTLSWSDVSSRQHAAIAWKG